MRPVHVLLASTVIAFGVHVAIAQARAPGAHAVTAAPSSSAAPPSSAAPAPPSTPSLADSLTGQPKADYDSARMLFGVSDFAGAVIKFTAAYTASKDARLLFNMATCESKLHHYAKALGLMRGYLTDGGALLTDQDRAEADAAIKAFEPLTSTVTVNVAETDPRVAAGDTMKGTKAPAPSTGATVTVDDEVMGQSPLAPFVVDIGVHRLRVSKPEYQDFTADLTVTGAAKSSVDATLALIVHEGRVSVRAGASDAIAIDGAPVGTGTWAGPLKSGGHTLRVTAQGMLPYQSEVLVEDGQARDLSVTLEPEPSKGLLPAWAWITGGVVIAGGLGVGGYFLFKQSPTYTGPQGNLGPGIVQAHAPIQF